MSNRTAERANLDAQRQLRRTSQRPGGLRTLDGVIMLASDGRPAGGAFPDNVWVVMGGDGDSIEEFFGDSDDVITAGLTEPEDRGGTRFCVGFDTRRDKMVMNGDGAFPVYVSGLLKLHLGAIIDE